MTIKERFVKAVEELDETAAMDLAEEMIRSGCTQMDLVDLLLLGMKLVGLRYEGGEYFIADLIMSGIIFRNILGLDVVDTIAVTPRNVGQYQVVVGTVEGDVHDIGKDIFISMLESKGIRTCDLGVDVSPGNFLSAITRHRPRVVVMSGTMTFVAEPMKRTIRMIEENGLRSRLKIMVGGGGINQETADQLGADAYSADLLGGSALCKRWVETAEAE